MMGEETKQEKGLRTQVINTLLQMNTDVSDVDDVLVTLEKKLNDVNKRVQQLEERVSKLEELLMKMG